jgi:hypothetical protein
MEHVSVDSTGLFVEERTPPLLWRHDGKKIPRAEQNEEGGAMFSRYFQMKLKS